MSRDGLVVTGSRGRIELTGAALASLATRAAETVADVRVRRPRRGLEVAVAASSVHVEVEIEASLGSTLPDVGAAVQRAVADAVGATTGLPTSVDVLVEELA